MTRPGRPHRRTGCETVVDEDDGPTLQIAWRTVLTVLTLAPFELHLLASRDGIDGAFGYPVPTDNVLVEHPDAAGGYGAHCELLVSGSAELADEKDVERRAKRRGHLVRNRDAPPRQREDNDIRTTGVRSKARRKCGARPATIQKGPLDFD
jgi:hypothetical protein